MANPERDLIEVHLPTDAADIGDVVLLVRCFRAPHDGENDDEYWKPDQEIQLTASSVSRFALPRADLERVAGNRPFKFLCRVRGRDRGSKGLRTLRNKTWRYVERLLENNYVVTGAPQFNHEEPSYTIWFLSRECHVHPHIQDVWRINHSLIPPHAHTDQPWRDRVREDTSEERTRWDKASEDATPPLAPSKFTASSDFEPDKSLLSWLEVTSEIHLETYRAVGEYYAFDGFRTRILTLTDTLREQAGKLTKPYPVLLLGKPGAGKTFLVKQLAREIGAGDLIADNLTTAHDLADAVRRHCGRICREYSTDRYVAYLDECDVAVGNERAFRLLLPALNGESCPTDGGHAKLPPVVWFLTGSRAATVPEFEAFARQVEKGPDFLRRFKENGDVVEVPGPTNRVQSAIQAMSIVANRCKQLRTVAKGVLFYFGQREWKDAGEIKHVAEDTAKRVGAANYLSMKLLGDAIDSRFYDYAATFKALDYQTVEITR